MESEENIEKEPTAEELEKEGIAPNEEEHVDEPRSTDDEAAEDDEDEADEPLDESEDEGVVA